MIESSKASATSNGPGTVLVVDDDPQLRRLMVRLLERDGYSVRAVSTSNDAESALDEGASALWLIDATVLPGGALPLLERAARTEPRPGVVLTSGGSPPGEQVAALEAIGGHFLPKPFSPADFRRTVAKGIAAVAGGANSCAASASADSSPGSGGEPWHRS